MYGYSNGIEEGKISCKGGSSGRVEHVYLVEGGRDGNNRK